MIAIKPARKAAPPEPQAASSVTDSTPFKPAAEEPEVLIVAG